MKECDLVEVTKWRSVFFKQEHIVFSSNAAHVFHHIDRTQWIRVITNLVQNALQSVSKKKTTPNWVHIIAEPNQTIISIMDNGNGIPQFKKIKYLNQNLLPNLLEWALDWE